MAAAAPSSSSSSSGPNYALYRASGLGKAFVESVGEMFLENEMTNDQVIQALLAFDKVSAGEKRRSAGNSIARDF
jgi:hypothetical protein